MVRLRSALFIALAASAPGAASAVTFFGEDINTTATGQNEDAVRIAHPNADAARDAFLAGLSGVATETFEGSSGLVTSLTFGPDTATLSPGLNVLELASGTLNGVYPISGDKTLLQAVGAAETFTIGFSTEQAAFGFYATDVEIPGNLLLRFTLADGVTTVDQLVPTQAGTGGVNNTGSVIYFGIIDTANPFIAVSFIRALSGIDGYAFDDMTIGRDENVVPEAGVLALLAGALALALSSRRRRSPLLIALAVALPGAASAVYLNDQNIAVSLGPSMAAEPFENRTAAASLASIIDAPSAAASEFHTQETHVWVSDGTLELVFDLQTEHDLTTLHFWNYHSESHDVDEIDFLFYDASNNLVGSLLDVAPALGGSAPDDATPIFAEDYALSFPSQVRFVNAVLSGSNAQVDFNNLGFTGEESVPEPVAALLLLAGLGVGGGWRRGRST